MQALVGRHLPDVFLQSTEGGYVGFARMPGRTVVYCYPYTGQPGVADPPGWNDIPGAHGSTPQTQAYSKLYPDFLEHHVKVFGVSFQKTPWQLELVQRLHVPFGLLSDHECKFAAALALPRFYAGERAFLERLTLGVVDGVVRWVHHPVPEPAMDAAHALAHWA